MGNAEYFYSIIYDNIYENILERTTNEYIKISCEGHLHLININSEDKPKLSYSIKEHWHDWLEFLFVTEGSVEIILSNKKISLSKMDIIMIPYGVVHSLHIDKTASVTVLQVSGSYLSTKYPWYNPVDISCCSLECIDIETSKKYNSLIDIFKNMIGLFEQTKKIDRLGFNALFELFLYNLYENFKNKNNKTNINIHENSIINILSYIHLNYKEQLTQTDIARKLSITPQHLSRLFKTNLGINYLEYLYIIRLNQAVYELKNSNKSITEILYDCGFPNKQSFIHKFKKQFGILPNEYRKKLLRNITVYKK